MVRNGNEYRKSNLMSVTRQPFPIQTKTDKKTKKVEYCNCLGSKITEARCTREIISMISLAKAEFNKKNLLTSKLDLTLRKRLRNSTLGA